MRQRWPWRPGRARPRDHRAFDTGDIEQALFGSTVDEALSATMLLPAHSRHPLGGALVPRDGKTPYRNLSAVVACDWFDTLDRANRGRRLHCLVLHHWAPLDPLPERTFAPFGQIVWHKTGAEAWRARHHGDARLIAKFPPGDSLELHPYSTGNPW